MKAYAQVPCRDQRGVALLLVLWVITLLSVICAEFSWTMRSEMAMARNFNEGMQAYYIAEAGINRAIVELMRAAKNMKQTRADDENEEDAEEEQEYWTPGAGPIRFDFAGAFGEIAVEDETNKIDINRYLGKKSIGVIKNDITRWTGVEGEERDIVADSLKDWHDTNHNVTGVNGAEDDYYEGLDVPYECRDGNIPVIEELLLVRGVTEELFYGRQGKPEEKTELTREELDRILSGLPAEEESQETDDTEIADNETELTGSRNLGLASIFTAVNHNNEKLQININTASVDQIMLLEGMDEETAREIVAERSQRLFASKTDRLPQYKNYAVWQKEIEPPKPTLFSRTNYYRITSRGYSPDGTVSKTIICSLRLTNRNYSILAWQASD